MCRCKNVDFGSYDNTVSMKIGDEWVCIDTCIASEIGYLWHQGIKTLNSCCGHNKLTPSVIVAPESTAKMHELGYSLSKELSVVPEQTFELKPTPIEKALV